MLWSDLRRKWVRQTSGNQQGKRRLLLNRRKLSLNRRRWLHCNKWWARSFFCKMPQSEIWAKIGFLYAKKYTVFLKKVHHRWLWRLWILSVMCICFQWHVITGGLNSVFSLLVCSTEFKLLNSIVNTRDLDFFAPNDVPSYLPKIFSDQGFFHGNLYPLWKILCLFIGVTTLRLW